MWGRNPAYHPRMHSLVPGGGAAKDGTWLPSRATFLLPVKALSKVFRAKFRDGLRQCVADQIAWEVFARIAPQVCKKERVVHSQPAGNGLRALRYLAPYIFRVAISNLRFAKLVYGQAMFRYRTADTAKLRACKLPVAEFIRRFLQRVLPRSFVQVRYDGFLASGCRPQLVALGQLLRPLPADDSMGLCAAKKAQPATEPESSLGGAVRGPSCGRPMHRRAFVQADEAARVSHRLDENPGKGLV